MNVFLSDRLEHYWFFRYKLYHIPFWAAYHLMWGLADFSLVEMVTMLFYSPLYIMFLCYVFLHSFAVYFNLYFLFPRYLEKGKLRAYIVSLSLWTVFTSLVLIASYFVVAYLLDKDIEYFCGFAATNADVFQFFLNQALPSTAGAMLLGMSIKLAKNWSQAQKQQRVLEKEKLETELKFLRNQFNPHFLFNSINSIFFLIHKDPERASTALAKFSELLRYQLYECNEKQISLSQEMAYLENFVALEKLRKNQDLRVNLTIDAHQKGHLDIAPFILMTFVENAFKHVSKHQHQSNWIEIRLALEQETQLIFEVSNSKSTAPEINTELVKYGGIGLKNVQRRLDLIYPDQYELLIENHQESFRVKLQLKLTERAQAQTVPSEANLLPQF